VSSSFKELLVLQEDQLHARGINLHILTGICAGLHRPDGTAIADKMLFMVAAMAAEMERDLIRERTLDRLRAAQRQGRRGGRPAAVNDDILAIARARRERGESVTAIARHLGIGRSTLYRALELEHNSPAPHCLSARLANTPRRLIVVFGQKATRRLCFRVAPRRGRGTGPGVPKGRSRTRERPYSPAPASARAHTPDE